MCCAARVVVFGFCASSQMTGWRSVLVPPISWRSWLPILVYCCMPSGRIPRHAPLRRPPACFRFLSSGLSIAALVSFSSCLCRPRKARRVAAYWCCVAADPYNTRPMFLLNIYHHLTGSSLCQCPHGSSAPRTSSTERASTTAVSSRVAGGLTHPREWMMSLHPALASLLHR